MKYYDKFHPNCYYHVFNHAVGSENLFRSHDNYLFFLGRFYEYMLPVCKIYCYCLMPNHFHFFIKIREGGTIMKLAKIHNDENFNYHKFIMQQLSNFLNSYAKAFNKQNSRMGALFLDYTKRIELKDDSNFTSLVRYIHGNPVHHGFTKLVSEWPYSSYNSIIEGNNKLLERDEILEWFGGLNYFIESSR